MLLRHLLCGIALGAFAALSGVLAGFSPWSSAGFYVLGGVLGLGASILGALSAQPYGADHLPTATR